MRKIDSIDFFYLSMPQIFDIGDGSQDALLVRVTAGDRLGWGECEASPLTTIASLVCPMSHSACKPVAASVLGERIERPEDIAAIHRKVRQNSMDLLQADHALSGIDVALWDLLGQIYEQPVYQLLGAEKAYPKLPYSSLLFGDTPHDTYLKARHAASLGFGAVKFGWGPFGHQGLQHDIDQIVAARDGLGQDRILCVDAGTVWGTDVEEAARRLDVLKACRVTWLEEPFHTHALRIYHALSLRSGPVKLAGGEGAHNEYMAQQMIDFAGVGFIQVDTGRIGGITSAKRVFDHAQASGVTFINHTFTSHLALSASLQVFAGSEEHRLCEHPGQLSTLAYKLTPEHLEPDANGEIRLWERPGLGIAPDLDVMKQYLVDTTITVSGKVIYRTPVL